MLRIITRTVMVSPPQTQFSLVLEPSEFQRSVQIVQSLLDVVLEIRLLDGILIATSYGRMNNVTQMKPKFGHGFPPILIFILCFSASNIISDLKLILL